MPAASRHDAHAARDYRRLAELGIRTARDGVRWHRIETSPGRYDFSCDLPLVRAARDAGVQVVWDLCHYGWPDDLDIFSPRFVDRFAAFARAFARVVAGESDEIPFYTPVNEISFFAWAGGNVGFFHPFAHGRGDELKAQLVRASIAATQAVWEVDPRAHIVHPDPTIHVAADPSRPEDRPAAERYTASQFDAWDMIAGLRHPELGGDLRYLDIVGVNYYPHNQWIHGTPAFNPASALKRSDPLYRPFGEILGEVQARYGRPVFIAETGIEGPARPGWLRYVAREVRAAMRAGVPLEGICLYPIADHPGWDDDRHCPNGLLGYVDEEGERPVYEPLAEELRRQQRIFDRSGRVAGVPTVVRTEHLPGLITDPAHGRVFPGGGRYCSPPGEEIARSGPPGPAGNSQFQRAYLPHPQ